MSTAPRLSQRIDARNDKFTVTTKKRIMDQLPELDIESLEWLIKEHYQFSYANVELLSLARDCTAKLADKGVTVELQRNIDEEDGHAPMYRQGMRNIGTDVDEREEFAPTTAFLTTVRELSAPNPSRALGTLYATETAAIFEHETFFELCREVCERRGHTYQGSLIKKFHDIHLDEGVEQGHKDGLAEFVDVTAAARAPGEGEQIDQHDLEQGAYAAIDAMQTWWDALLDRALKPVPQR
ncbi:DUF3865 domain-containing protein [Micromonospora sp. NPDC000207]|uniref:DUF3865 domain-containing protein n=1 Tax=unclassified Micromonospora TaxID=2617518 RepID=UPI00332EE71D